MENKPPASVIVQNTYGKQKKHMIFVFLLDRGRRDPGRTVTLSFSDPKYGGTNTGGGLNLRCSVVESAFLQFNIGNRTTCNLALKYNLAQGWVSSSC